VVASRRDTGEKETIKFDDVVTRAQCLLEDIHTTLFNRALAIRDQHISKVTSWDQFTKALDERNMCLCAWCNTTQCEEDVKKRSVVENVKAVGEEEKGFRLTGAAKTLCTPFSDETNSNNIQTGTRCFACDKGATTWTLFGRSY
jgi:prolyl-tRNA synthetase